MNDAIARGRAVVNELIEHSRTTFGQDWLGPRHGKVTGVGSAYLINADTGQRLPVTKGLAPAATFLLDPAPLTATGLCAVRRAIGNGDRPSLSRSLLADAAHAAFGPSVDSQRAVLAAAMSCEIGVRGTLRRCASPTQRAVLDVLLDNPHDFSIAAHTLFNDPMAAVTGTPLKGETAPTGEKKLNTKVQDLFTLRNRVAHQGVMPSDDEANDAVRTAAAALDWLDARSPAKPN